MDDRIDLLRPTGNAVGQALKINQLIITVVYADGTQTVVDVPDPGEVSLNVEMDLDDTFENPLTLIPEQTLTLKAARVRNVNIRIDWNE